MNATIIIFLIGCATAVALVAIICDHLFEKKTVPTECLMSKKIIKIHRNYIAGFLGFAVIMLITSKYGGPNNAIFDYLSFGSTITAMVLSVLAIFVTVQSSTDMYKQFTRIDNATDTIKNASDQIEGTLSELKIAESKLQNTSKTISEQLDNIVEQIDDRFKTHMKETEDKISKQLEESFNSTSDIYNQDAKLDEKMTEKAKTYFITTTSASGLLAVYACSLSMEKNKPFELSNIFKGNESYTFGFLIALLSTAIILFTHDDKNNQITCQKSLFSSQEVYDQIKQRITQPQLGRDYFDRLNTINAFFDISPLKITIE